MEQAYTPSGGSSLDLAVNYSSSSPINSCSGGRTDHLLFIPYDTHLTVTNMAEYSIQIGMQASALPTTITVECTNILSMVSTSSFDPGAYIELIKSGVVSGTGRRTASSAAPTGAGEHWARHRARRPLELFRVASTASA